jgi:hypothetical protein
MPNRRGFIAILAALVVPKSWVPAAEPVIPTAEAVEWVCLHGLTNRTAYEYVGFLTSIFPSRLAVFQVWGDGEIPVIGASIPDRSQADKIRDWAQWAITEYRASSEAEVTRRIESGEWANDFIREIVST